MEDNMSGKQENSGRQSRGLTAVLRAALIQTPKTKGVLGEVDYRDHRKPGDEPISSFEFLDRTQLGDIGWVKRWREGPDGPSSLLDQPAKFQSKSQADDWIMGLSKFFGTLWGRYMASRKGVSGLKRPFDLHSGSDKKKDDYNPRGAVQDDAFNNMDGDLSAADMMNDAPFPRFVLNPRSFPRLIWNIIIVNLLVYNFFICSFRLAFESTMFEYRVGACKPDHSQYAPDKCQKNWGFFDSNLIYIEYCVDVFFFIDFWLQPFTASFRKNYLGDYHVVVRLKRIFFRWLRTWFIVDILSAIPWEGLHSAWLWNVKNIHPEDQTEIYIMHMSYTRIPRWLLMLKIPMMFRITRIGIMDRYIANIREQMALRTGLVRILKFVFVFGVSLHSIACILFYLGSQYEYFAIYREAQPLQWAHWLSIKKPNEQIPTKSWFTEVKIVVRECNEQGDCFSGRVMVLDAPLTGQYLMSVYWVATTMSQVGYGDLRPFTQYEVISLIFAMILGASLFSYIVGNATQLIAELQGRASQVNEELDSISRFMVEAGMSKHLRQKSLLFLSRHLHSSLALLPKVVEGLPPDLVSEIKLRVFARALYRPDPNNKLKEAFCPLLAGLRTDTISKLLFDMKVREMVPMERLWDTGERPPALIFIMSGNLEVMDPNNADTVVASLGPGNFCGENLLVPGQETSPFWIRARGWTDVAMLTPDELAHAVLAYKEDSFWMATVAQLRWSRFHTLFQTSKTLRDCQRKVSRAERNLRKEGLTHSNSFTHSLFGAETSPSASSDIATDSTYQQGKLPTTPIAATSSMVKMDVSSLLGVLTLHHNLSRPESAARTGSAAMQESFKGDVSSSSMQLSPVTSRTESAWLQQDSCKGPGSVVARRMQQSGSMSKFGTLGMEFEDQMRKLNVIGTKAGADMINLVRQKQRPSPSKDDDYAFIDWSMDFVDDDKHLMEEAEALHAKAFPRARLTIHIRKADNIRSARATVFESLNIFVRVVVAGRVYETAIIRDDLSPEWDETFVFKFEADLPEDTPMNCYLLDNAGSDPQMIGMTGDVVLTTLSLQRDRWEAVYAPVFDLEHEMSGILNMRYKYEPLTARKLDPDPMLANFLAFDPSAIAKRRLIETLHRIVTRLEAMEGKAAKDRGSTLQKVFDEIIQMNSLHKHSIEDSVRNKVLDVASLVAKHALAHAQEHSTFARTESFHQDPNSRFHPAITRPGYNAIGAHLAMSPDPNVKPAEALSPDVNLAPSYWKMFESRTTGKPFWYNKYTKVTQWTDPALDKSSSSPDKSESLALTAMSAEVVPPAHVQGVVILHDLPFGWVQRLSQRKGAAYFQNLITGETSWSAPSDAPDERGRTGPVLSSWLPPSSPRVSATGSRLFPASLAHGNHKKKAKKRDVRGGVTLKIVPARVPSRPESEVTCDANGGNVRIAVSHPIHSGVVHRYIHQLVDPDGDEDGERRWEPFVPQSKNDPLPEGQMAGIMKYAQGDSRLAYYGHLSEWKRHGVGVLQFADGVTYYGQFEDDLPHGHGVEVYPDGSMYKGEFFQDHRQGLGCLLSPNVSYSGGWSRGKRQGSGMETYSEAGDIKECVAYLHDGDVVHRSKLTPINQVEVTMLRDVVLSARAKADAAASSARALYQQMSSLDELYSDNFPTSELSI